MGGIGLHRPPGEPARAANGVRIRTEFEPAAASRLIGALGLDFFGAHEAAFLRRSSAERLRVPEPFAGAANEFKFEFEFELDSSERGRLLSARLAKPLRAVAIPLRSLRATANRVRIRTRFF